uniref:RNA-directed DNA polymerase n=1 Tax=Strongyloides stercoralis TaxID=6248 RepID=A0A0K0ETD5_STRER
MDVNGEEMGSRAWERVDRYVAAEGQSIDLFLDLLDTAFSIDRITNDQSKIARLKLSVCRETYAYLKEQLTDEVTSYQEVCNILKRKYSGTIEKEIARSSVRNFKIDFSAENFKNSCQEFYRLNVASGVKDDVKILEDLARRIPKSEHLDDIFDYLNRHMDNFHSFLDAIIQCESMLVRRSEREAMRRRKDSFGDKEGKRRFKGRCDFCKMFGHKEADCRRKNLGSVKSKNVVCYECQEEGHISTNCTNKSTSGNVQKSRKVDTNISESETVGKLLEIMIYVNGRKVNAMLDTGSTVTLLPVKYAKGLVLEPTKLMWMGLSSKDPQECKGVATVVMSNGTDKNVEVKCLVVDDDVIDEVLLGLNFVRKFKRMSYDEGILCLDDWKFQMVKDSLAEEILQVKQISVSDKLMSNEEAIKIIGKSFKEVHSVFSYSGEIGKCDIIATKQEFISADKVPFKEYQFPKSVVSIAEDLIDDLIKKDVIKVDRDAKMLSNIIVVRKKDSSFRPCVDLRMVNKRVIKDSYPIPMLEKLLEFASNAYYYANLDLVSAFFQIELNEQDKNKFGVWFNGNIYTFNRVPMGYTNAPFILQRVVDQVTSGLSCCKWYFDDCIICTNENSMEQHLKNVEMVLRRLFKHNLKISLKKSNLVTQNVKFLGHQLGGKMIKLTDEAINMIDQFPEPVNERQVRRFLGIVGFYRNNIPQLSIVAAPISSKLKKNNFSWDDSCRQSFMEIKRLVKEQSIVYGDDISLPLTIFSDASQLGFGAVIGQKNNQGIFQPILYFSKKRSASIRLKDSTYLEFMSIILCIRKFRNRILGRKVEWFCDNKPLILMIKKGESENAQYNAWLCEISMYDICFYYYPGKKNIMADYLSREVADSLDNEEDNVRCVPVHFVTSEDVRKMQEEIDDEEVSQLVDINGILGIQDEHLGKNVFRIYLPDKHATEYLKQIHERGHFGKAKTLELFNIRFANKNASIICSQICKTCKACQLVNRNHKRLDRERTLMVDMPRKIYGLDLCGPLHQKGERKKYLMVCVDYYSRFLMARSLESCTSSEVINELLIIFQLYGQPVELRTDNAKYVKSEEFERGMNHINVFVSYSTSYEHRGNTLAERYIKVLEDVIIKMMENNDLEGWSKYIGEAVYYINTSVSPELGVSAYELFLGTPPNYPFDIKDKPKVGLVDLDRNLAERKFCQELIRSVVSAHRFFLKLPSLHMEENLVKLKKGQKILVKNMGHRTKVENIYLGPFVVEKVEGSTVWYKKNEKAKNFKNIHITNIKKFHEEDGEFEGEGVKSHQNLKQI